MSKLREAEATVRAELGPGYGVVKLSQYWIIGRTDNPRKWSFVCQSTSLPKAIRDARSMA